MMGTVRRAVAVGFAGITVVLSSLFCALADEPISIAPGVTYLRMYRPQVPCVAHVVEADLSQQQLELRALLGGGQAMGRRTVSAIAAAARSGDKQPVATVNADFFALGAGDYSVIPLGLHMERGELVTFPAPSRSVLYLLADGTAHIGRFQAKAWLVGPEDLLYPVAALNRPPGYSDVVLFTRRFGAETRTAEGTTHISLVGLAGPLRPNAEVSARIASIAVAAAQNVPPDGAVLAARGVGAYALRKLKVGDEIRLRFTMEPAVGEIVLAVGGGPRLLREGRISVESRSERFSDSFSSRRHPRTGVGLRDGRLVMVAVDGRQPGYSEGMTLPELADLFATLGCREAINLDGGGSTTMAVGDQVVNSPSDGSQRPVANALALLTTAPLEIALPLPTQPPAEAPAPPVQPTGPPVWMALDPAEESVLGGDKLRLAVRALDEDSNAVPMDPSAVEWECPEALGSVDDEGVLSAARVARPVVALVVAKHEGLTASSVVRVVPAPTRLAVEPSRAMIGLGATQPFAVRAYDDEGRLIRLPASRVEWSCGPAEVGAKIDGTGLLTAPSRQAQLTVTARVGEASAEADVLVGATVNVLLDFERPDGWSCQSVPGDLPVEMSVTDDPLNVGNQCLRLRYDLSGGAATRAAYAVLSLPLPDAAMLSAWVLGDGQGAWLRARLRDAQGQAFAVDLADAVDWSGEWRAVMAGMPKEAVRPLTLESVYVAEYHADRKPSGAIYLDDVAVSQARNAAQPVREEPPIHSDQESVVTERGGEEDMSELPTYICCRAKAAPVIDGSLSDPVWSRIEPVGDFRLADGTGMPQLPTELKVCWDDKHLYLGFLCVDTDIWGIMRNRDDPIYEEEVVEAFLSTGGKVSRYYEFNFSPHNVVYDAAVECPEKGDRSAKKVDPGWDCEGVRSAVNVIGTLDDHSDVDQHWTVEVALPFSAIGWDGNPPAEGERWRANFYRIDRAGDGEFSCWSPTLSDPPSFHVPARFGHLVFSLEER